MERVLDAPPERRAVILAEVTAGEPALRAELERWLADGERELPLVDRPVAAQFDQLLVDDVADAPPPDTLGDRYRIERELGHGGMARVYLAHDTKHTRDVAVKVIRRGLAASLGRERFLREIGIAARLRHPNIVPLYDSGDADGLLYFVMPYEEGPSLRDRLARERLSVTECLGVLRDIARALAYAHEHGVVHRDVKPDNVMLSGGAVVVTDFGIAKAVTVAQTGPTPPTLTQVGAGLGTPAYMAPEQAVGDPSTDHRADIYSFGCLAYEMFTGKPPFHGLPAHLLITAHVGTKAVPVSDACSSVPAQVAQLIDRCLAKLPADRPQSAQEVLRVLDAAETTGPHLPPAGSLPRRRPPSWRLAALAGSVATLGIAAALAMFRGAEAAAITLAVLPFGNTGADTSITWIAEGLADEVAAVLQRVPGLVVKSRNGARAYRGQFTVDLAEAGTTLKADYLVNGVVRRERGRWILSAELARAADAASLWSDVFNLAEDQQAGAAEAIAASLTAALRRQFPEVIGAARTPAANQRTVNSEAYRLYLRGRERLLRRGQSVKESADLFREAIREDTLYAPAYAGLSMALALFPHFQRTSVAQVRDDLTRAAGRALELDPTLALPHVALGLLSWFDYEWGRAEAELQTAIRLEPHNAEARLQYARYLLTVGRSDEAMQGLRLAYAEDPASAVILAIMASAYLTNGQLDSAVTVNRRALQNDSTNFVALGNGAMINLMNNQLDKARDLAERAPGFPSNLYVIAKAGDSATVRRGLRELDAMAPQPSDAETKRAFGYLGLGDTARALAALERATARHEIWHAGNGPLHPAYDSIRESPRFQAILHRIGFAR